MKKILNIYTDASIKTINNCTVGCAGFVTSNGVSETRLLYYSTNNESELTAISMGVKCAIYYAPEYDEINLYSDSKISILGLREWIKMWRKTIDKNNMMYSSSGKPVANLHIIKDIIYNIYANKLKINLYHTNGHIKLDDINSLESARKTFYNSNGIMLNIDMILIISKYNDYIDNLTRSKLENICIPYDTKLNLPINRFIDDNIINEYLSLINSK